VPARFLPETLAMYGDRIPRRAGLLVVSKGLVPPLGTLPSAFAAERTHARAVGVLGGSTDAADVRTRGASLVVASLDREFAKQVAEALTLARLDVSVSTDVSGVELAAVAKNVAVLAAAAAAAGGPNAAGTAAGRVFAEVSALARAQGCRPETVAGLADDGALVDTVVAEGSRNRRAGELLGQGKPPDAIGTQLGQVAEAVDTVAPLATLARRASIDAPVIDNLLALVEGRMPPAQWMDAITSPERAADSATARS
jgi:glycerol-3-phosphate dehydrogenase (NAD(P)+)